MAATGNDVNRRAWWTLGVLAAGGLGCLLWVGWPAAGPGWGAVSSLVTRGWAPVGYLLVFAGVAVAIVVRRIRVEWHARRFRRAARARNDSRG